MQILNSTYKPLLAITFPMFKGRQVRYHTFDLARPAMTAELEDYLPMVKQLCSAAGATKGEAYLTVDEKIIEAGWSQRRPRPHVDGCFRVTPAGASWGGGNGNGNSWLHYCNDVGASAIGRMPVIVAASVAGCRAWEGVFTGRPAKDGDLSHIADQLGDGEVLPANVGYLLSPDCVHESMLFAEQTQRSFIRIALPVDYDQS